QGWLFYILVSMKSPIFGPQDVSSVEGSSVSIRCYYPATSVNRHSRKYWCRIGAKGRCTTLISSEGYISKDYKGRANLTNFPENGTFVMDIGHLTRGDSGLYKCGLGISSRGLSFDVSLEVSQGPGQIGDVHVYTADLGSTVTINCPFKSENAQKPKSVYKKLGQIRVLVIDSNGYLNNNFTNRAHLSIQGTNQLVFSFVINRIQLRDAGIYICQAGDEESSADLQVLKPEPELIYGDLRGSVTFDCALGQEMANVAKFLCQLKNGKTCNVVINTLGKKAQDFEGRILLTPKENSHFSVHITGLRKEDAGHYLCGAHPDGEPKEGWPVQAWQLFINEDTMIPPRSSVVRGVVGGSVAVTCPYNPKETNSLKYWCRWEENENGRCPQLVESSGLVNEQYEGRLALYEEPGNGTFTVILNQLTNRDAGFYWCLTNEDSRWRSTVELKIVEGEPNLKLPENVTAWVGETLKLSCHFPCKFYSYQKYWCKWSNTGCRALPSQDEGQSQAFVNCDKKSQIISLNLNPVRKEDEGWYWCGVKDGLHYGETGAVYVAVEQKAKGSGDARLANAAPAPAEDAIEPRARETENEVLLDPSLIAEDRAVKDGEGPASGSGVPAAPGSSVGQGGGSKAVVSTLVPLALVMLVGAVTIGVLRARHRKNVDRISIRSYRTDISMSDFENSRDFGAHDNAGATLDTQETSLGGKDRFTTTTENTMEDKEPKRAKRGPDSPLVGLEDICSWGAMPAPGGPFRPHLAVSHYSSKEEADKAFTTFLLQANSIIAATQNGPREA
uniref:Polymeric immunoglobulin receptor n=1 Tax=Sus scrofa TaxID=9823 RepID=A0A8D0W8C1_PIG